MDRLLSLTLPNPDPSGDPIVVKGPPGVDTTSDILLNVPQFLITMIFVVGTILAIVFILLSGIQWILSGGDEKQIEGARKRLTYAIIGLVVIISSAVIVSFVFSLLGIDSKPFGVQPITQQDSGVSPSTQEQFDNRIQHRDSDGFQPATDSQQRGIQGGDPDINSQFNTGGQGAEGSINTNRASSGFDVGEAMKNAGNAISGGLSSIAGAIVNLFSF